MSALVTSNSCSFCSRARGVTDIVILNRARLVIQCFPIQQLDNGRTEALQHGFFLYKCATLSSA